MADLREQLQSGLADRYRIERELGRGGMATVFTGESEKALDLLEPLLKIPFYLSPGWLKVDPTFDPLQKNPRFQKLVRGS